MKKKKKDKGEREEREVRRMVQKRMRRRRMGYDDHISLYNYASSLSCKVCLCLVVEDWDKLEEVTNALTEEGIKKKVAAAMFQSRRL
jgi:hypothetical protein